MLLQEVTEIHDLNLEILRLRSLLDKHGIIHEQQTCACNTCENLFTPSRTSAKYCSDTCKNRAKQQRHRVKVKLKKESKIRGEANERST